MRIESTDIADVNPRLRLVLVTLFFVLMFTYAGELAETKRLDAVLQKCLAKDVDERFASAAEMQRALIPAIQDCPSFFLASEKAIELDADTAIM